MPLKGLTSSDIFIVDTETGEWNKLSTLEEAKLGEPSKEEIDRVFNKSPETFDCKILSITGFYIALVYDNSTYLRFPKNLRGVGSIERFKSGLDGPLIIKEEQEILKEISIIRF